MSFANTSQQLFSGADGSLLGAADYGSAAAAASNDPYGGPAGKRPSLPARMSKRLGLYLEQLANYLATQFNEHTAASIASCSVLIIVLSIMCCFILSLWREEQRRIKAEYMRLSTGSSQSFIAMDGRHRTGQSQRAANMALGSAPKGKGPLGAASVFGHKTTSALSQFQTNNATGNANTGRYQKIVEQQSSVDSNPTALAEFEGPLGADPTSNSSVSSSTHLLHNHHQQPNNNNNNNNQRHRKQQQLGGQTSGCRSNRYDRRAAPASQQQVQGHNNHRHLHPRRQQRQQLGGPGDKLRLHELRRETYYGLVRLSRPGCRTVVLLCDAQSRAKLLTKFYQCVYPYRKNKTLQFAFLLIERNIGWYEDLLKSVLSERCPGGFRINPINCIGTVLVLNGFKKLFSVYHASNSRWNSHARHEEPPSLLLEETLLDSLPEWLERLFMGKVSRYYVESWPDRVQHLY